MANHQISLFKRPLLTKYQAWPLANFGSVYALSTDLPNYMLLSETGAEFSKFAWMAKVNLTVQFSYLIIRSKIKHFNISFQSKMADTVFSGICSWVIFVAPLMIDTSAHFYVHKKKLDRTNYPKKAALNQNCVLGHGLFQLCGSGHDRNANQILLC